MKFIILMTLSLWTNLEQLISKEESDNDTQYLLRMVKEDQLEKKLQNSEVFKECVKKIQEKKDNLSDQIKNAAECLEEKVKALDKGQAEKLIQSLDLDKVDLYGDPNQKNLAQYIANLTKKALYGEAVKDPTTLSAVDQETFLLVYERAIGKALFLELADYCLRDSLKGKKINLDTLSADFIDDNTTRDKFTACRKNIQLGCDLDTNKQITNAQACLFNRRMSEFKKVLHIIKEDKTHWEEIRKNSSHMFNLSYLDKHSMKKKNPAEIANEITNLSSSEIIDKSYGDKTESFIKQIEDVKLGCQKNYSEEACNKCLTNPNDKNCGKIFNRGVGQSLGQYRLQRELELDLKIKALSDIEGDRLNQVARESNFFSKTELENLKNKNDDDIRKMIEEKYTAEKLSIQKYIDDKIQSIGISRDEDLKKAQNQVDNIYDLLINKPDEIRAVYFFSNVIVSHFTFKNDPEKKKRVFSGIDKEIKDLEKKQDDPKFKNAMKYLQTIKSGSADRSAASDNEHYYLDPEEIDHLLFGSPP